MVLVVTSDGYAEDLRGDFASYEDACDAFEKAVHFVDELSSRVDDYPLTLDTVQLLKDNNLILIWQRPPWRTEQLLRDWARRHGDDAAKFVRSQFVGVVITAQQTIAADRAKPRAG